MTWIQRAPGLYEGIPMTAEELERLEVRVRISNLPLSTRATHRFSTWEHNEGSEAAFAEVVAFLEQPKSPFLSLLGGVGLGKTHLAIALAWEWLERGKGTVLYYQTESLLDELRKRYRSWERGDEVDPYQLIEYVKNCSLFVLDDLGAHKPTAWAEAKLDEMIDHRYINQRATVITSNFSLDMLPERVADRMAEGVIPILGGKSYRKRAKP